MADGYFPTLISKDRNDNALANPIFVNLSDGTNGASIDGSGNLQVILASNDGTDIGDVTINNGAGASAVNIQDGGNSITIDDGGVSITVDGTVSISGTVTVTATDLDIRDLVYTQDSVAIWANTAKDGTGTDYQPLVDADGHLQVDILSGGGSNASVKVDDSAFTVASDSVTAIGAIATADSVDAGDVGALRMLTNRALVVTLEDANGDGLAIAADGSIAVTDNGGSLTVDGTVAATQSGTWNIGTLTSITNDVNIADGGNSITVDDGGASLTVDGTVAISGTVTVTATDLDIRDLTSASDSVEVLQDTHDDLNANVNLQVSDTDVSAANPVPVTMVDPGVSSTEVHDYDTAAAVAAGTTDTHTLTASGGTLIVRKIAIASSGGSKFEVQNNGSTILVGFVPRRGGFEEHKFEPPVEVANGNALTIIRTNRQLAAQDLYSTIEGNQL